MNLTKKQIDIIIQSTKPELKGQYATIHTVLGYFRRSGCNWCYRAGYTANGDLVVTVFGTVQ